MQAIQILIIKINDPKKAILHLGLILIGTKINITDFGTKYNVSAPSSSKPFKGHMNKTRLYFPKKHNTSSGNYENWGFMDLEMSFELYRAL